MMDWAWWPVVLALLLLGAVAAGWAFMKTRDASTAPQRKKRKREHEMDPSDTLQAWVPTATRVLTKPERDAYHVLRKALPEHVLLAQVPLARFLRVPTRNSYNEWLRRVGSLCADIVVCDGTSQVIAVVEVRQPINQENPRAVKRHARMDRVLRAAGIPVHVWLADALPGAAVAREAILGSVLTRASVSKAGVSGEARRSAEAAAVVASMQATGAMHGMSVNEGAIDFYIDEFASDEQDSEFERKNPPPSTWFDDMDSGPMGLDERSHQAH